MSNLQKVERYISEYIENNEQLFQVYVCKRSKKIRNLRAQKRVKGITSLEEARRVRDRLNDELVYKLREDEAVGYRWAEIVERWELYWREFPTRTFNDATLYDHISRLHNWTDEWMDRPINELKIRDARNLIKNACHKGASIRLRKMIKRTVNAVFKWAIEEGFVTEVQISPAKNIEILMPGERHSESKRPEILTWHGIHKLVTAARVSGTDWFPIWFLAIHTGLRSSELEALSKEAVELVPLSVAKKLDLLPDGDSRKSYGFIKVEWAWKKREKKYGPTKAHYWRQVPINQEVYYFLLDYLKNDFGVNEYVEKDSSGNITLRESERLFPLKQVWRRGSQASELRAFCESNGLQSIKFHTLRACFATQLLAMGVSEEQVRKIGGWKDAETMRIYVRTAGIVEAGATQGLKFLKEKEEFDVNSPYSNTEFIRGTRLEDVEGTDELRAVSGENVVTLSQFRNK